jgi:hypothetical protein
LYFPFKITCFRKKKKKQYEINSNKINIKKKLLSTNNIFIRAITTISMYQSKLPSGLFIKKIIIKNNTKNNIIIFKDKNRHGCGNIKNKNFIFKIYRPQKKKIKLQILNLNIRMFFNFTITLVLLNGYIGNRKQECTII